MIYFNYKCSYIGSMQPAVKAMPILFATNTHGPVMNI
jgi:hypothetical protein